MFQIWDMFFVSILVSKLSGKLTEKSYMLFRRKLLEQNFFHEIHLTLLTHEIVFKPKHNIKLRGLLYGAYPQITYSNKFYFVSDYDYCKQ